MTSLSLIMRVLSRYQLNWRSIRPAQTGYRNHAYPIELDGGRVANLMLYKSEAGIVVKIRAANTVSNYLATRGFPARQTFDSRIIELRSATKTKYAALYHYLPGQTIPWDGYTMKHIKLLGLTLGKMHRTLQTFDRPQTLPSVVAEYEAIIGRISTYYSDPEVTDAISQKLGLAIDANIATTFNETLQLCRNLPGKQPLHMDFVRSNILFKEAEPADVLSLGTIAISGIIDFEKTAYGHPMFDIARTLAFLLVDCKYKSEAKIRKYFLYSGYLKRGGTPLNHRQLLEPLLDLFLTYDFYKFLRHNPYESLAENEHFLRTRDILVGRGVIHKLKAPLAK